MAPKVSGSTLETDMMAGMDWLIWLLIPGAIYILLTLVKNTSIQVPALLEW